MLALVLAMSTWFSAAAVLPQLRAEWDLSSGQGAWLTIAVQLGFVAGAVGAAIPNLSDVHRPQRVVMWGALGVAAANGLLALASGPAAAIPRPARGASDRGRPRLSFPPGARRAG